MSPDMFINSSVFSLHNCLLLHCLLKLSKLHFNNRATNMQNSVLATYANCKAL